MVPQERVFAMSAPAKVTWPFIRYGSPVTSGFEATCWSGSTTRVTLHAFAESTSIYAGEDRALEIAAAIVEAMKTFDPADLGIVESEWLNTGCTRDSDEADQWHAFAEFNVTVEQ